MCYQNTQLLVLTGTEAMITDQVHSYKLFGNASNICEDVLCCLLNECNKGVDPSGYTCHILSGGRGI